ncbi:MAG: isochorismatase family protein [Chlamydiales bacterium]|nr:isochorismatase family protein [Chlamydiales bacterium]
MDLSPKNTGLLLVDIQEKLFGKIYEHDKLLTKLQILARASSLLEIPIFLTEQYPQGLGKTVQVIADITQAHPKTTFSVLGDSLIKEELKKAARDYWIVAGIESHVCILQTVRDLLKNGYKPIVVQDAISSRNLLDHTSALQEMRALGARITTTETLLFELMQDAKHPHFKAISTLIK